MFSYYKMYFVTIILNNLFLWIKTVSMKFLLNGVNFLMLFDKSHWRLMIIHNIGYYCNLILIVCLQSRVKFYFILFLNVEFTILRYQSRGA